ncbi:hypothetical protein CK203_043835 [Vitis vinifera]|uniref:Reverse transcriptase domain-containing protein n=1 Tax=Vitis vinifera TaxID=29760 RepID=A0A438HVM4_VITVI|nr:hypothetical protein CK203_043835 [Vitis vinifera]
MEQGSPTILGDEERDFWRQKSRELWLKEEENDLKNSVVGAFQKLYSEEEGWRPSIDGLSFMGLDSNEVEGLENPFSEKEVFATLSDLGKDKAPGSDGFTMAFWLFGFFKVQGFETRRPPIPLSVHDSDGESQDQLTHLSWLLMWFEACSGLKINLEKSEFIPKSKAEVEEDSEGLPMRGRTLEQRSHLVSGIGALPLKVRLCGSNRSVINMVYRRGMVYSGRKWEHGVGLWKAIRKEWLDGVGDGWTPLFSRALNDWEIEMVERFMLKIQPFRVQREVEDKVVWTASRSGVFSVKSLYFIMEPEVLRRAYVPPKVAFLAWEAS